MLQTKSFKKSLLLFFILLFALLLRVYRLAIVPPHLTPDEAAIGYNAYSILKTGRDEYGKLLPFVFKSFGDYKPGLFVYLTVPFAFLLGLSEFSVRLPGALLGVAGVYLTYLIVRELFKNEKLALVSCLLLAISPWHIFFSRGAWEIGLNLTLSLAGILFFLKSIKGKDSNLILAAVFFGLTLFSYQGAKLSTLLIIAALFISHYKKFLKIDKKTLFLALFLGAILTTPFVLSFVNGKTGRLGVFSLFSYTVKGDFVGIVRGIFSRFFNHFSGRFLFFEGDFQNLRHTPPYQGVLLLSDLVLLPLGIFSFSRLKKKFSKEKLLLVLLLFLTPLPAVLTRDQVHAVRAFNLVFPLTVISSFGGYCVLQRVKRFGKILFVLLVVPAFIYFADSYFVHLPIHDASYWYYGYKQIALEIKEKGSGFTKVKVQQSFAQPYIYYLFFANYPPEKYQVQANLVPVENSLDVGKIEKIDNISFTELNWPGDFGDNELFFVDATKILSKFWESSDRVTLIDEIKNPAGQTIFYVLKT